MRQPPRGLPSRRELLAGIGVFALAGVLPAAISQALAQEKRVPQLKGMGATLKGLQPVALRRPVATYRVTANSAVGPWGEVRIVRSGRLAFPYRVRSSDGLGLIEMGAARPYVQIGVGRADAITWNAEGVSFGKGLKPERWTQATARKLTQALGSNRQRTRALMRLRSALLSSYPAYLAGTGTTASREVARSIMGAQRSVPLPTGCSVEESVEYIDRTQRELLEIWDSVDDQFQRCFEYEMSGADGLGCSHIPRDFGRDVCAITACVAKNFVPILLDVIESVTVVTEEVVRHSVVCPALAAKSAYIDTMAALDEARTGLERPGTRPVAIKLQDVEGARAFLQEAAAEALGPLARAFIAGRWTIQSRNDTLRLADGTLAFLYDVSAHLPREAVVALTASAVVAEAAAIWVMAVTILAAVHAPFAAFAATWGIVVPVALAAAVAVLAPAVAAAVSLMMTMIILAVCVHGSMIQAQIALAEQAGEMAQDGEVQVRHATLSVAQLKAEIDLELAHAQQQQQAVAEQQERLQPPIVVG